MQRANLHAVPFGFPSHQGLLAPLWRRWPTRFAVIPLWVGAVVPDLIDGVAGFLVRGHLGQWAAHSILGLFVLSVPIGVALAWGVRIALRRVARRDGAAETRLGRLAAWTLAVDAPRRGLALDAWSVWVGALSHIVFDLASHERSKLLWPWREDPLWFGSWWQATWFRVSVPGYDGYSIGPHFVGWIVLSVLGAVMFFAYPPRVATDPTGEGESSSRSRRD